jgi:ABC-type nitrate/sulfonate/bicarbonate transport system permease component
MQRPVIYWRIWGEATALLQRARQLTGVDLLIVLGLAGLLYGLLDLAKEWAGPHRPVVEITLSPTALPKYAFYSLMRGLLAYMLSLGFTLLYGYWAAKDRVAERVLIPLLDILQSIPVLGFLPGLVLGLTAAFPYSNVGLELAAIVMIFTGQVWNMTFSFYQSLRSLPQDMQEVAAAFRLNWWQRLRWLELPGATMGLVWNSMMSMAGGWFFLMINETYHLGDRDFRLPGLGSYMSVAVEQGRVDAMLWAILAMTLLIVALDQLLWRPLVVWAQKFRIEETGTALPASSWFLTWLRRSTLIAGLRRWLRDRQAKHATVSSPLPLAKPYQTGSPRWTVVCSWAIGSGPGADTGLGCLATLPTPTLTCLVGVARTCARGHGNPGAGPDFHPDWHPLGRACRSGHRSPTDSGTLAPTGGAGGGIVSRADVVPAGNCRTATGWDFPRLGQPGSDVAGHAVVHPFQCCRWRHECPGRPA